MDKIKVHIISHTHWDREWFLPATYTSPWLVSFFDKLFFLLDKYKNYKFVLDGQVQVIEDYLGELEKEERRKKEDLLKKYIREKRLFIGPYWAQIDWQIPGAESIVRNILLAHRYIKKYGEGMKVGWLPDTFGQIGQVPQIHKLAGMDGVFVWRGVEFPKDDVHSEFEWIGPDGTGILSVYFLASYRNLMGITSYPEIADDRLKNEVEKIAPFLTTKNAFLMNGYDLDNSPEYPLEVIHKESFPQYDIFQSDPEMYVKDVKRENPSLIKIEGELLSGRYLSVFPGKLSTRMYLKIENYICEHLLSRVLEPLGIFSWIFSNYWPQEEINALWKELILNEIHDNISGVGVDQIHRRMEESYERIINRERELLNDILSHILPHLRGGKWVIFNTGSHEISAPVYMDNKIYFVNKIPPLGFKVEDEISYEERKRVSKKLKENFVWDNTYYRAEIFGDGKISIFDKSTKKVHTSPKFFLDREDKGDEYNWSPGENMVTTIGSKAKLKIVQESPLSTTVRVETNIESPMGEVALLYDVSFDNTPLIRYRIKILNRSKNHRLDMVFSPDMKSEREIISHMPFEYIRRPEFIDNSRSIPEKFSRIFIGAREWGKDYEFPMGDFLAFVDEEGSFAVFPKGIKEYEIHGKDLHVILLRSVGWISKADIESRTGDAGPFMYTPDAQCIGELNIEFAIYVGEAKPWDKEFRYWKDVYQNPPIIISKSVTNGDVEEYSLFSQEELEITGTKVAEDEDGIIIRGFNPANFYKIISIPENFEIVNLLEEPIGEKGKELKLKPFEIVTFKLGVSHITYKNTYLYSDKKLNSDFTIINPLFNWNVYSRDKNYRGDEKDLLFLEKTRENLKEEIVKLKRELSLKEGLSYHRTMFEILSRERTYLEATLSLLLNKEINLPEGREKGEIREKIKDIGILLNDARIKRRAYEYVLDFYLHNM